MPTLSFPPGQAMGTLGWLGSDTGTAPVLATGVVTVPDGAEITLDVRVIESVRKTAAQDRAIHGTLSIQRQLPDGSVESQVREDPDDSWEITGGSQAADLSFLRHLPADAKTAMT